MKFDSSFWEKYYTDNHVPWDMGQVSPPLQKYFDGLTNKSLRILIPGAGNGHEAEYLWKKGFNNVYVVDLAAKAIENFRRRVPDFPQGNIFKKDFFELKGHYDLIVEQTFFCALVPTLRRSYARKMHQLLATDGYLAGLLFTFPLDRTNPLPPFGGSVEEYRNYFDDYFHYRVFTTAYNSHPARKNRELFMLLQKK